MKYLGMAFFFHVYSTDSLLEERYETALGLHYL